MIIQCSIFIFKHVWRGSDHLFKGTDHGGQFFLLTSFLLHEDTLVYSKQCAYLLMNAQKISESEIRKSEKWEERHNSFK